MKKYISILLCAALAFAACQPVNPDKDDEVYQGIKAKVEMSSADPIPADGGQLVVTVTDSPAFTVSFPKTATSWLSVSQAENVITFTANANPSAVLRYASVSLIDQELKIAITNFDVMQAGTAKDVEPVVYKTFSVTPESIEVAAKDQSTVIAVNADDEVAWTITSDNPAFVAAPASGNGSKSVTISFPANEIKAEVTANITISTEYENVRQQSFTVSIIQAAAKDEKPVVKPAPGTVLAEWYFAKSQLDVLKTNFTIEVSHDLADAAGNAGAYVEPNISGKGRLEYYHGVDKAAAGVVDKAHKRCKRIIGTYGEPCVYGTYKQDYILWTAYTENEAPIAAGTKLHLFFVLRPNNEGVMKYWLIEYLDGDEWKPALPVTDGDGFQYNIELFFEEGAQTNTEIEPTVTLSKDTDAAQFRITCTSSMGTGGSDISVINAAWALRFAGEDCNANHPEYSVKRHPIIDVVE